MTAKQVFEYALVELNKKDAPSLLLEDYNYFINKAVNQYVNKMYNAYDVNQQKTDDLRVLKGSAILIPSISQEWSVSNLLDKTYDVDLPDDYLHILNCVVEYNILKSYKCYNAGTPWQQGAKRATADMLSQLIHNYYMRPSYKNPYFYINNITTNNTFPTRDNQVSVGEYTQFNIEDDGAASGDTSITLNGLTLVLGTDWQSGGGGTLLNLYTKLINTKDSRIEDLTFEYVNGFLIIKDNSNSAVITVTDGFLLITSNLTHSLTEKNPLIRYGNRSKVRMEIRYGKDNSIFQLSKVYIDYLKTPQFIRLTQDEVDEVEDISQILEFPDYVCQEIVNELVKLLMENSSDPRLQTNIPINQSIANPQQQQTPQKR